MNDIIKEIEQVENINLIHIISKFERNVLKHSNIYRDFTGLEDYKMNYIDYIILYIIWKILNLKNKIQEYLVIMYSYYKLEEFHFPLHLFEKSFSSLDILINTNIIKIINIFIN
tara:strand:+ start:1387 stop:1728 length:342 start_codon:yes stop_codon:yes gene_type:complete